MKGFFFPTGCVSYHGTNAIRVRLHARQGDKVSIVTKGDRITRAFLQNANLTIAAKDTHGKRGTIPTLPEHASAYTPYIDVILDGPTSMAMVTRDGVDGLLIEIDASVMVGDPAGSWPFSSAAISDCEEIHFHQDDSDVGPHWPLHTVIPPPKA